jgi:hypothetical protein
MMLQRHDLLLTLVVICGAYNIAFAVFHTLFWRVFGWPATIRSSGHVNSAITQTLNLMLIYCFSFYGGWLIWAGANGIRPHPLLLVAGGGFWLVRTALQPLLFRLRRDLSTMLTLLFITGAVLHLLVAFP